MWRRAEAWLGGICSWSALRAVPCTEGARHAFRAFHVAQWTPGAPSLSVQPPESRRACLPSLRLRPPFCTTISGCEGPAQRGGMSHGGQGGHSAQTPRLESPAFGPRLRILGGSTLRVTSPLSFST